MIGQIGAFLSRTKESLEEDYFVKNVKNIAAILYGGPVGLFCVMFCSGAVFFCYAGKLADTLVVPISGLAYFTDKKQIMTDKWWEDALKVATDSLNSSGKLMISPIAIPIDYLKNKSSQTLDCTGMGEINDKSVDSFLKAANRLLKDKKVKDFSSKEIGLTITTPKTMIESPIGHSLRNVYDNSVEEKKSTPTVSK